MNEERNWDNLKDRFDGLQHKIRNGMSIYEAIQKEFGSYLDLAFYILQAIAFDRAKYSSISAVCTKESKYFRAQATAEYLHRQSEKLEEEFKAK